MSRFGFMTPTSAASSTGSVHGRRSPQFRYDDPEFPPAEAVSTPVIEIHFDDVHIRHWEDDEQALTEPSEYHGQVSAFDHDGDWFDLQTFTLRLAFTAERVQVTLSANEHGP
ncbi:MAG: hypothetical protein QOJ90_250 [Actinomycetota bacterium]|jgi:hypothetical protein|nr:hypothetical protein [Actinomycetota bacterium]MDQ1640899.1 hypothetical protein [Actinomycetota bacterium]